VTISTLGVTHSVCNTCRRVVPAKVITDGRAVYFRKFCPRHGEGQSLVRSDPADYLQTLHAWLAAWAAREPQVRAVIGDADLDREIADHLESVRAIEDGLLKRSIYVATKRHGLSR
jgi:hypothetical protein